MKIRRIAAAAAAASAALTIMSATASAYEYTAFLMFTDYDWLWSNWSAGTGGDVVVNGPGTYTVSLSSSQAESTSAPARGTNVFCVDIVGAYADLAEFDVTLDSVKADGNEVKFDPAKICYGDIEEKGTYRIEIQNAYGETGDVRNEHFGAIDAASFSAADKIEVTFTIASKASAVTEPPVTTAATTPAPIEEVIDENGKPNEDDRTKVTPTGNFSALALIGVMSVSAAAAFVAKKSEK